jgi:hypothetical protein
MSKIKSTVAEQAKDENTKLGGFLKRGTAVAEKAVSKALNSEVCLSRPTLPTVHTRSASVPHPVMGSTIACLLHYTVQNTVAVRVA